MMFQDIENKQLIKSTVNINKTIYLIVGKVKGVDRARNPNDNQKYIELKLRILELDKGFKALKEYPAIVYLVKKGPIYLPVRFDLKIYGMPFNIILM